MHEVYSNDEKAKAIRDGIQKWVDPVNLMPSQMKMYNTIAEIAFEHYPEGADPHRDISVRELDGDYPYGGAALEMRGKNSFMIVFAMVNFETAWVRGSWIGIDKGEIVGDVESAQAVKPNISDEDLLETLKAGWAQVEKSLCSAESREIVKKRQKKI